MSPPSFSESLFLPPVEEMRAWASVERRKGIGGEAITEFGERKRERERRLKREADHKNVFSRVVRARACVREYVRR